MKRVSIISIFVSLTLSLFAFSGHITSNTTWNSDVIVTGDTWIDEGVTLTIAAGVTVYFPKVDQNSDGIGDVDFIIEGRLLCQGTEGSEIVFTSYENDPQPSDWGGIDYQHVQSQNSNLQYTNIYYAHQGCHVDGKLFNMNHCIIAYSGDYGVRIEDSHSGIAGINDLTIFENGTYGLKVESDGLLNGTAILASSNGDTGFWIEGSANTSLIDSRSVSNDNYGVLVDSASPVFSNTSIKDNAEIGVFVIGASSAPEFDNCTIESNEKFGFFFQDGSGGTVEYSNIIANTYPGIFVKEDSYPVFNYCNIHDNCPDPIIITENIPTNELYVNSNGYSDYYSIQFPLSTVDQIHVSGAGNHTYYSSDYYFSVNPYGASSIYEYVNQNTSNNTNFNLWTNINSSLNETRLRVYLNTYEVSYPYGRVSQVTYDPFYAQFSTTNSTGVIDAQLNWWGQISGVDSLVTQLVPGTVNYATMQTQSVATAGATYSNLPPELSLFTPDSFMVNPTDATITWSDIDVDDNAQISLYYDDGLDQTGVLITDQIDEDDTNDSFLWDFADVPYALYYVYGVIDDGENAPVVSYAPGQIMVGPVSAAAPEDAHGVAGGQVSIPISVANTYDYFGILSFQFILNFDHTLLTVNDVETSGTLTENWTVNFNDDIPGQITVNGFTTDTLSTSGTLLDILFDITMGANDYEDCILNISEFTFNDGGVDVEIHDGLFTVLNEYVIDGNVEYYSNAIATSNVELALSGAQQDSVLTDTTGAYVFAPHIAGDYVLTPSSEEAVPELVITPYDASLVARYALDLEAFSNEQIIAGDVNDNGETTAYDAAFIAQYSVELIDEFIAGKWKFSPAFSDFELVGGNTSIDFAAIAIGDPSGNCFDTTRQVNDNIFWEISTFTRDSEEILELAAYFSEPFLSTYASVTFDSDILQFSQLRKADFMNDFQTFSNEGLAQISFGAFHTEYVQSDAKIFSLEFVVTGNIVDPEDVIDCNFLLFDEQEGDLLVNTGSALNNVVPARFALQQNYPNPFNPETKIAFSLPVDVKTSLEIFNIKGQKVQTLLDGELEKGTHRVVWNADAFGSGVYFYKLKAGDFTKIRKMILIK